MAAFTLFFDNFLHIFLMNLMGVTVSIFIGDQTGVFIFNRLAMRRNHVPVIR